MQPEIAMGYTRYSTDKQDSTAVQIRAISKYCAEHSLVIPDGYMFSDEGLSGTSTDRRLDFAAMLRLAQTGTVKHIVLYDVTRGSRDVVDWFTFRRQMQALGVRVHSVMDRLGDLDDPNAFLTELITVGIGQSQVLTSRAKSMDKVDMLAQEGKFLGGYAPYGYRVVDGVYTIDESEARVVRMIFDTYASGHSYSDIIACLPAGMVGRRGREMGKNSLHYMLKNERYKGTYTWNARKVKHMGKWAGGGPSERAVKIEGGIPAIIDSNTWERVRKRMDSNKYNKANNSRRREYLLTGLLRCGYCGHSLIGVTTTNTKGYEHSYYTCVGKRQKHICKAKNLPAVAIETLVMQLLRKSVLDGSIVEAAADSMIVVAQRSAGGNGVAALKREQAKKQQQAQNLLKVLLDGMDSDIVRDKLSLLEAEIKALGAQIAAAAPAETVTREELVAELARDSKALLDDPKAAKALVQKYITGVTIWDDAIEIHSVADLALDADIPGMDKKITLPSNDESVTAAGCGGPHCAAFTLLLPRVVLDAYKRGRVGAI